MAVYEAWGATELIEGYADGGSYETEYFVDGVTSEAAAKNQVKTQIPSTISLAEEILVLQDIRSRQVAQQHFLVRVRWGPEDEPDSQQRPTPDGSGTPKYKISFSTTGGSQKITVAKKMIKKYEYSNSDPAPETLAINYDGEKINGTEVVVPVFKFNVTVWYPPTKATQPFAAQIARNTGKTNSDTFLNFAPGELLFMGGDAEAEYNTTAGSRQKPIPFRFSFEASENITGQKLSNAIPSIDKKGWEYLSIRWQKIKDQAVAGTPLVPVPYHVWIFQTYDEFAFGTFFGFGGT